MKLAPDYNKNMTPFENKVNQVIGRIFGWLFILVCCAGLLYLLIRLTRMVVVLFREPF